MENTSYWRKQSSGTPLFPDLLWSQPEHRNSAGKLLIIGGNLHAFSAPAEAFGEAEKAGAGTVRVVLPDAAKKIVGRIMEHVEYAPSTPSGSFGQKALVDLLETSAWADGVLIAGDLGRNSETAIVIEKFLEKHHGQVTLSKDAVDYAVTEPTIVQHREETLLVMSFAQLQKLAQKLGFATAFTFDMDVLRFVDTLHEFTKIHSMNIIVKHHAQIYCATKSQIVSTKLNQDLEIWRVKTAAHAAVWWLQNSSKPLEAYTTAVYSLS